MPRLNLLTALAMGHSSTNYDQVHFTSYGRQGNLLTKTEGVAQVCCAKPIGN